jgi:hypothetical protein
MTKTPQVLLVGNGINRTASGASWSDLLGTLDAKNRWTKDERNSLNFPVLFEALALQHQNGKAGESQQHVKEMVAAEALKLGRPELLSLIDDLPADHILTTNYDYLIEGVPKPSDRAAKTPERKYSLFRWRERTGNGKVWHIHGEALQPASIMLGSEHYVSHTARVREYLSASPEGSGVWKEARAHSPLTTSPSKQNSEFVSQERSWVDHFLVGHVHVLGFGFDESETLIWWLLMFRQREARRQKGQRFRPGNFTLYVRGSNVTSEDRERIRQDAHIKLMKSFGVEVIRLGGGKQSITYSDFYRQAIVRIRKSMEPAPA